MVHNETHQTHSYGQCKVICRHSYRKGDFQCTLHHSCKDRFRKGLSLQTESGYWMHVRQLNSTANNSIGNDSLQKIILKNIASAITISV